MGLDMCCTTIVTSIRTCPVIPIKKNKAAPL